MINKRFLESCSNQLLKAIAVESKNPKDLKQLLEFKEEVVYMEVAQNSYTDKEMLTYLYNKYGEKIITCLASNDNTAPKVLHQIAIDSDTSIAKMLLENTNLETATIYFLVDRFMAYKEIIKLAIYHPNTSAETLIKISLNYGTLVGEILNSGKVKLVAK